MQIPQQDKEGSGASGNGSGKELQAKVQGSQEEQDDVSQSVAGVVQALTELASVQTPASVWLPSKHLTVQLSGKVSRLRSSDMAESGVMTQVWQCLAPRSELADNSYTPESLQQAYYSLPSSQHHAHASFSMQCTGPKHRTVLHSDTMEAGRSGWVRSSDLRQSHACAGSRHEPLGDGWRCEAEHPWPHHAGHPHAAAAARAPRESDRLPGPAGHAGQRLHQAGNTPAPCPGSKAL